MIEVRHSKSASFTPAFALIAEGWNELVQSGLTPEGRGDAPFDAASEVLYAEQPDGEVVGVVCFRRSVARFQVSLVYVEPTSRKQGVFAALLDALKRQAREARIGRISGDVHPDNEAMQAVMARLQALPVAVPSRP